jgi:transcriptional regulator with XRE-family HTH domain
VRVPKVDAIATGRNIRRYRKEEGFTQTELANCFNFTTQQMVWRWENGKSVPSVDNLVILSFILGVSIDDLIIRK